MAEETIVHNTARALLGVVLLILSPVLALWRFITWRIRYMYLGEKLPGPKGWPLLGVVPNIPSLTTKGIFDYFMGVAAKYGDFTTGLYIGPILFVYTKSPKDLEMLLSGYKYIHKGIFYKFLHPWLATGLLTSTGEKWRSRRKALTPAFHFKIIDQFVPVFNSCSDVFVQQMRARVGTKGFDVWEDVKLLTLDVICETAIGYKINAQTDRNSEYVKALTELLRLTAVRMFTPWLFFDWIYWLTPAGRRYKKCLSVLHGTTDRMIRERRKDLLMLEEEGGTLDADELGRRRRLVFLDLLILMARDGSLSDMDIREEVDTFLFEGHDTSSAGISFTIFLLSRHSDVQQGLQQPGLALQFPVLPGYRVSAPEFGALRLTHRLICEPSPEKIYEELKSFFDTSKPIRPNISEISELKYLDMVIKESLRLYPPVTLFSRDIHQEIVLPDSQAVLPAGSSTILTPLLWHRNPDVYPDPEKFDPERFSADECARRHPYAYLPFSAGPRNCIGQRFAMLEMKNVIAKLVWNFRVLPEPGFEPSLVWEIILKSQNGLFVRLEERQRESN
ncbi:Probable cytochrome P450 4p2 [Gryllus bimaculatus]|nr:Probable cytochrome P450 4p2 [Gryllus bimaculatus]